MAMDVNEIYRLMRDDMMGVVMRLLKKEADELPYELQNRFENVEMLVRQYYKYEDKSMTAKVRSEVLELADDMMESIAMKSAIRYEYSIRRNWHINSEMLMTALSADYELDNGLTMELDAQLIVLFRQVWLSGTLDANAINKLREFIMSDANVFARRMTVGAMMLKCIRRYDMRFVEILMSCPLAEAYVAVALIAMACRERIECDPLSLEIFRNYMAESDNQEKCALVYDNVMKTFETQNIANEMRDKIIPIVREQGMKFQKGGGNVQLFDMNGLNPEWEERLEESGLMDRMRKINDMQLNGADIHYESFQMMKSSPFFMDTAHWFFPFDMRYHQLGGMGGGAEDGLGELPKLLNLCDSDRYSLFLMLKGMGIGSLGDVLKNLGIGNCEEVREQLGNEEAWKETRKVSFAIEVRFAVMNLYRFYNLAPNHSDLKSPFIHINPADDSELEGIMMTPDTRYRAASVLFKARQWKVARGYFLTAVDDCIARDAMIYQKIGYCSEKMQRWQDAVDEYEKSDIIMPDDIWTLRHSALCHRQLGNNDIAARYYKMVLDLDKGSLVVIDNLSEIYMDEGDYEDAKPLLYEMEYQRGGMDDSRRLGFCLFMIGERIEAMKYFDKACSDGGASADEFLMRAVCSGKEEYIAEACAIIFNAKDTADRIGSGDVGKMMDMLEDSERERFKSTINKIILEQ